MNSSSFGTYLPAWTDNSGRRVLGYDEDVTTLAVAAGEVALAGGPPGVGGELWAGKTYALMRSAGPEPTRSQSLFKRRIQLALTTKSQGDSSDVGHVRPKGGGPWKHAYSAALWRSTRAPVPLAQFGCPRRTGVGE